MILAPGVEFFEDEHEYFYKGKKLSGITGLIAKKLGIKMPQQFVGEHQAEGLHIHKAVQTWLNKGVQTSRHPGLVWFMSTFWAENYSINGGILDVFSEVLVSDFKRYASSVDIICLTGTDMLDIYDIKTGKMNREYVSWQLGVYKYFIETTTDYKVNKCCCVCTKDKEYYPVFPVPFDKVEKLLYGERLKT